MQQLVVLLFFYISVIECQPAVMSPRCQDGWYEPNYYKDWKGTCYYFFTGDAYGDVPMTFEDGRTFCQKQGTTLLTFKTEAHFTTFTEFMDDNHRPPDIDGKNYSFWIGYSSLYKEKKIFPEGVSMNYLNLTKFPKFNTSYDSVILGDLGVAMVVEELPNSRTTWHMVPKQAYNSSFSNELTKNRGFICSKPIDDCVCGKWRNAFIFTFDGRQLPLEPHSHYWLVYSPPLLGVVVETSSPGAVVPSPGKRPKPPGGLPIRQVYFWCMKSSNYTDENNVQARNVSFVLSKNRTNGWYVLMDLETSDTYDIYQDAMENDPNEFQMAVQDAIHDVRPETNETDTTYPPLWWTGQILVTPFLTSDETDGSKAVVVTTPYYKFIWDGQDIQVQINASNTVDENLYGLCYRCKSDKTNDYLPRSIPEAEKVYPIFEPYCEFCTECQVTLCKGVTATCTQKIYIYARGTIRYPQFAPTFGLPSSCQSYALHETALESCRPLIDTTGPLSNGACLYQVTMHDSVTNPAFTHLTANIYQSCVETVCLYGVQARCYYFEKLINFMARANCSTNVAAALASLNCSAQLHCPSSTQVVRASAEFVSNWTFKNGVCLASVDGSTYGFHPEKSCQSLGGHLVVPHTKSELKHLVTFLQSNETIIGVMSSTQKNISSIPAFRKLETFDGEQLMVNFSKSIKNNNDQTPCFYVSKEKFERRDCNFSTVATVVCSMTTSVDEKAICPQTCRFPLKCNRKTKSCVDPCPNGYVSGSGCMAL